MLRRRAAVTVGAVVALVVSALSAAGGARTPSAHVVAGPGRARPPAALPDGYEYVVPPVRISPDGGALGGAPPFFREPHLLVTESAIVTAFMEMPPNNTNQRVVWVCTSREGREWSCTTVDRGATYTDAADPWLADTRGDPCPRYGTGITLATLRSRPSGEQRGQTVTYTSSDMGRTWSGPEAVPEPAERDINPDGSKIEFTGRTWVGYREFIVGPGQFVTRLGTDEDACAWSPALPIDSGSDHPRLSATNEPGGLGVRSAEPGTLAGGTLYAFNSYDPQQAAVRRAAPMAVAPPPSLIPAFCTSDGLCRTGADVGETLLYDPVRDRHHHVYVDRPLPDQGHPLEDLVVRHQWSDDGGLTWSLPAAVAGSGVEGSTVGAASFEPTLAWDEITETVVLAYYEKPTKDSLDVQLRLRVLGEDGVWAAPVTVDETPYVAYRSDNDGLPGRPVNGEPEFRFGDYFGLQACGGVAHVVHHPLEADAKGSIAYAAVRYAAASPAEVARACPAAPVG